MQITRIGVVGSDVMGSGIAQLCVVKGFGVVVCQKNDTLLHQGMAACVRSELK